MEPSPQKSPWDILGIAPTNNQDAIRQAYLEAVRQNHPDLYHSDPEQARRQEEAMKAINLAYQSIRTGVVRVATPPPPRPAPPSWAPPPRPSSPPPMRCRLHGETVLRRCTRCQEDLCSRCIGFYTALCAKHYRRYGLHRHRVRVAREWLPLIGGITLVKELGVPASIMLWGVLGYLALVGVGWLRRKRWLGCLALLFFPYSLVLAGLYSLYEGLSQWNKFALESKRL